MIPDFMTIPNFFQNPEKIVDLAIKQKYYSRAENPESQYTEDNVIYYHGKRTLPLSKILDNDTYQNILKQYFDKVFKFVEPPKGSVGFEINCLFHSLTQYDLIGEEGFHNDSSDMAGVVYLNNRTDIDPFRHGTTIIRDGERIHIPYEYNKLILYRGSMRHSASTGFGKDIADSRLTFNMFFNVK